MATTSAQEAFGARYAISILAAASVNILGLIAFLIRRRGRLLLVLASVQALNIVFAVIESFITANPGWLVIGAAPATITLVFIYLLWRTDRPTTSAAE